MKKFSNYDQVEAKEFTTYEKLELGGHYCRILDVKEETFQGKEGPFSQLLIKYDTDSNDKQPGYYANRFKQDAEKDAMSAKWKGYYRLYIPKDDGTENDERTKIAFKTFITSIEKSNNGYDWEKADWDEKTLVGKKFIGIFGIREFENPQGIVVHFTDCRFIRSTEGDIEKISIPKVKLVDGSFIDYEEWLEKQEEKSEQEGKFQENIMDDSNSDDLPF